MRRLIKKLDYSIVLKMMRNAHFWIIIGMIIFISLLYYQWHDWFPWFRAYWIFEYMNGFIGSLFLIPFIYSAVTLGLTGSLFIWFLCATALIRELIYYSPTGMFFMHNMLIFFSPFAIILLIIIELKWREKQKKLMADREKERLVYISQVIKAQENEREHIARELHDGAIQELIVTANYAQRLVSGKIPASPEVKECGENIRDNILNVANEARRLCRDLRPSILDNLGLVMAIKWLVERLNNETNLKGRVVIKGEEVKFSSESDMTIFRIVQEALSNIRKHSGTSEFMVIIEYLYDSVKIMINDYGKGFIPSREMVKLAGEEKFGIIGMQQRAQILNGTLKIFSKPNEGTSVLVEVKNA